MPPSDNAKPNSIAPTKTSYALRDDVLNRLVQIVQEAFLTGVDCTDLLRQIRLEVTDSASLELESGQSLGRHHLLSLTSDYRQQVKEGHERMVAEIEKKIAESALEPKAKFITEF